MRGFAQHSRSNEKLFAVFWEGAQTVMPAVGSIWTGLESQFSHWLTLGLQATFQGQSLPREVVWIYRESTGKHYWNRGRRDASGGSVSAACDTRPWGHEFKLHVGLRAHLKKNKSRKIEGRNKAQQKADPSGR